MSRLTFLYAASDDGIAMHLIPALGTMAVARTLCGHRLTAAWEVFDATVDGDEATCDRCRSMAAKAAR